MAKDFKASQVRTTQIIASGSTSGKPSLVILSASSPGVNFDGSGISSVPSAVGNDVFVFVSGSTNSFGTSTRGVTLFGGDIVISGTAYNSTGNAYGNVAGSNKQVQFNDSANFGADSGLIYDKIPQALSVGTLYVTGTGNSLNISGSVTIAQNLTVKGTTTTIETQNLVVKDPIIYFGSSSTAGETTGGIALASGSNVTNQAMVFGKVATNTWGVGRFDVQAGQATSMTTMEPIALRASKIELGNTNSYLTASSNNLIIQAADLYISTSAEFIRDKALSFREGAFIQFTSESSGQASITFGSTPGNLSIANASYPGPSGLTQGIIHFDGVNLGSSYFIVSGSSESFDATTFDFDVRKDAGSLRSRQTSDVNFFVTGSVGSKGTSTRGTAVFGGDVVISGTTYNNVISVGTLYVTGASLNVSGNVRIGDASTDSMRVTANSWFDNNLNVSGSTKLGNAAANSVQITGNTWVDNQLNVSGNVRIGDASSDSLQVTSNAWYDNNLNVSGNVRIGDASTDSMQVTSNAWFDNSLRVTGSVWINTNLNVTGSTKLGNAASNSIQLTGNTWVDNQLNVSGNVRIGDASSDSMQVTANSWFDNGLNVSGSTKLGNAAANAVQITGNTWFDNSVNVSGSLLIAGNLEVRGMVTGSVFVVTATNMTIADQVIYLASGSKVSNTDGGIAITSGSSVSNQALVWGRVATDTWGAGRQDVTSGTTTDLTAMTLVPVRASRFEVGGSSVLLLNGSDQYSGRLIGSTGLLIDPGNSGQGLRLGNTATPVAVTGSDVRIGGASTEFGSELPPQPGIDTFFFVSGSKGSKNTSTRGVSVFGGDVVISGTLHGGSPLKVSGSMALSGSLYLQTQDSAPSVGTNESVLYVLDSGGTKKLYWKNSDGTQQQVGTGGGSTTVTGTFNDVSGKLSTTGTFAVAGNRGFNYFADSVGTDVNFFVSGTSGSKGTSTRGTSVFGGDLIISGTVYGSTYLNIGQDLRVTGSIASNAYTAGSVLFAGNSGIISQDNTNIYFDDANNRLGLATTAPQQTLHVKGKTELEGGGVTANLADQIVFAASTVPTSYLHKLQTSHDSTVAINNKITFDMWNGSTNLPMFSISGSGNSQFRGNLLVGGALTVTNGSGINAISVTTQFPQGISGSHTKLAEGTSYLIAGTNVTITTGSNGAVTIASTGGGGSGTGTGFNDGGNTLQTTSSVAFAGGLGSAYYVANAGSDINFFVSGSTNSKGTSTRGTAVFGGDVTVSGTLYGGVQFGSSTGLTLRANKVQVTANSLSIGQSGGNDVSFFVSGSVGSRGGASPGTALFGGDVVISGSLLSSDLITTTGNIIGAPGSGANVMTLLSSGNIIAKLDVDNNAAGHKFEVQDYRGISQFLVGEDGNSQLSGSMVITGSVTAGLGLSGSLTKLADGTSYLIAGNNVTITTGSNGAVTIASTGGGGGGSGDPNATYVVLSATGSLNNERVLTPSTGIKSVDGGSGGNFTISIDDSIVATISGTTFTGDVYTQNLFVSGNTKMAGNLTINGTVTSVSSSNLNVADPIIYLASGSVGPSVKSAIAFASGSTVFNQSLIIGSTGFGNTIAVAKQDVQSGTLAQSALSFTDLTPFRAAKFEAGGSSTYISSSNASTLEIAASTQVLILSGGAASSTDPRNFADTNFFVSGSTGTKGTSTRGTAVFGGDVVTSGTVYPGTDLGANLGSPTNRWGNIYTGDLHLKNDRGDYTLIEEEDCLTIRFNKTGKRYRFLLERAPEYDEK